MKPKQLFRRRCTDVQIPPVFYRTLSPFGAEALLTPKATIDKLLSRARVPETLSCLWATGYISYHVDCSKGHIVNMTYRNTCFEELIAFMPFSEREKFSTGK